MKIISLDPGKTTGYTVGNLSEEDAVLRFYSSQAKFSHHHLYYFLETEKPDWIVYESFDFRNGVRTGTDLIPAELIGVVRLYVAFYKCGLSSQNASTHGAGGKSGPFSDKVLRMKGIHKPGKPHAMDSLRILLYWYEFKEGFQFNKKKGYEEMMVHHL